MHEIFPKIRTEDGDDDDDDEDYDTEDGQRSCDRVGPHDRDTLELDFNELTFN